jgi:hypothetical protein
MSNEAKYPSQLAERFQVRMPDGLRDRIREEAEKNNRSMNAEIVARLEGSFSQAEMVSIAAVEYAVTRAITRMISGKNSPSGGTLLTGMTTSDDGGEGDTQQKAPPERG